MHLSHYSRLGSVLLLCACLTAFFPSFLGAIGIDQAILDNGYIQSFDALPSADFTWGNDSTLKGWYAAPSSGGLNTAARANDGSSNLTDLTIHSVGSGSDRAINYHTRVNTADTYMGLGFTNTSGVPLSGFTLACSIEQWRESTDNRTVTVATEYRVGAAEDDLPASNGWTAISGMTANSLGGSAGSVTPLDSGLVTAPIPVGESIWIRWKWRNSASSSTASHDTMALDDVSFTPVVAGAGEAPQITLQPVPQEVGTGGTATFSVEASGTPAPSFQWFHGETPLAGAVNATLVLENVQLEQAGDYSCVATNYLGSATSESASLTVSETPQPPQILSGPDSQVIINGGTAFFSVEVTGTQPLVYQWYRDNEPMSGEDQSVLELTGVSEADEAGYHVTVTNAYGAATSGTAILTTTTGLPSSAFNLAGFGEATTGGGVIPETDPGYVKVATPLEFVTALADKSGSVKVIEILNDLDLGYLEVEPAVRDFSLFRQHATPKLHPRLIVTGVSLIDIQRKTGLTIFSANGSTIRHASFNIKASSNIIIRNLRFDELWEWDEASKGDYDSNDWDFISLGNAGTVWDIWIDHCTFTKAYDGICDIKGGSYNITFSWNNYVGDDGATNSNSFVRQQINKLEENPSSYPMYNFLRSRGFSVEDIVQVIQGTGKTHLIGANSLNSENADHAVTFHHQWYQNTWDRLPRLRAGNVHNYNILVDDERARQAKRLRDERVAAMNPTDAAKLSSSGTYNFNPFLNGTISTEDGAILVEKSVYLDCLTPLRNNQTDPSNPVYTGKILGIDCITRMTDNEGVSVTVRGDSTDSGNPMGPFQAPIKPFSWNLPGGTLPYTYITDDPVNLAENLFAGAGAGRLSWAKENWLKTSYLAVPSDDELLLYAFGEDPATGEVRMPELHTDGTTNTLSFFRKRAGVTYATEASDDLVNWTTLSTNPGTVGEWVEVTDSSGSQPRRFYRLRLVFNGE
ncbi:MAG: immunoglobulin domain-containing protein [Puniceicoccaceae bacterium]